MEPKKCKKCLEIKDLSNDSVILIHAETMNELIDISLPKWLPIFEEEVPLLKKTKAYKIYGKSFLDSEKKRGWYYNKK